MRVVVLYAGLSGYIAACLQALRTYGADILLVHWPVSNEAPFKDQFSSSVDHAFDKSQLSKNELRDRVVDFQPDVMVVSGWMDKEYLSVCREMKKKGVMVVAGSDTQYTGSVRQKIGNLISPWYLHKAIDVMWVTGERQKQLACHLGYKGQRCWEGFYTCDWDSFRQPDREKGQNAFLFTGRLIPRKGISSLLKAYQAYRENSTSPWELWVVGAGPLAEEVATVPGVVNKGFVQPSDLPALYQQVSAFVLPSRVEPWGVVVHEAAAAGLPIICTDSCGAGVHLVRDHFNGYTFQVDNVSELTAYLTLMAGLSADSWRAMSKHSYILSQQYHPSLWVKTLITGYQYSQKEV